jgi:uncharacterized protein
MKSCRVLFLICLLASAPTSLAEELPTIHLSVKGHPVIAEVAATQQVRTTGLMHRFSLQPGHGMLFVFSTPQPLAFWMRNTFIPLSIAFIGRDGKILNIEDMSPQTDTPHPSRGPAQYALEMKKGWFAERGVGAGDRVEGLDHAPRARE